MNWMRHTRRWTTVALGVLAALAVTVGLPAPGIGQLRDPKIGGTLVFGFDSMDNSYDPAVFTSWTGINTINNVFDTLVQTTDGSTFKPGLATSWTISSDGKTYAFQLRRGVKFHDGTPFNAEAVKFSIERQINPNHPGHAPGMTQAAIALGSVERVDVAGEYEARIVLKTPNSAQLANLAIFSTGIVSPDAVRKYRTDFAVVPIGTGPFRFQRLDKGQQVVLQANEQYWGGRPYLDRVIIRAIPEDSTRKAALVTGEIDLTTYVDPKDMPELSGNRRLRTMTAAANSTGYMAMNARHEALAKKRVRQALCTAINRKNIIDVVFSGGAVPVAGWLPPILFAHDRSLASAYPFDANKAKAMLSEAGYPNGFELTFDVQAAAHWPRMAELVQEDFRRVGVRATIQRRDPAATAALVNAGRHNIWFSDWTGGNLDPDYFMFSPFHSDSPRAKGRLNYGNPEYDKLVEGAVLTSDIGRRRQLYSQAQKIIVEDAPLCSLYYNQFRAAMKASVNGFDLNPIRYLFFKSVWMD
jgi:peptide/nickel transport system substrate-binding protein